MSKKKEAPAKTIYQLDIKAQHFSAFDEMRITFKVLSDYGGRGRSKKNGSIFIKKAFHSYNPDLTQGMVDSYLKHRTVRKMLEKHDILSLEDFYILLSNSEPKDNPADDLPPCERRGIRFDITKEDDLKFYSFLKDNVITEKQRAFLVYIFLRNMFMREDYQPYFDISIPYTLQQIINMYYNSLNSLEGRKQFDQYVEYAILPHIIAIRNDRELTIQDQHKIDTIKAKELKELFGK